MNTVYKKLQKELALPEAWDVMTAEAKAKWIDDYMEEDE